MYTFGIHPVGVMEGRHLSNCALDGIGLPTVRVLKEGNVYFPRKSYQLWQFIVVEAAQDRLRSDHQNVGILDDSARGTKNMG
ncbi:hypothetical protein [Skermania pinensis]|uniref:hypothetical protein n=1 Tax=Skermania pinensis TaxID=39122 RepID=UPI0014701FC7|nr:hypothetical protein [Skermania piniformis]